LSSLGFLPLFLSFLPSQVCFFPLHILYNICFLISNPPFQLSTRSGPFALHVSTANEDGTSRMEES
jgi:hypothetical protein